MLKEITGTWEAWWQKTCDILAGLAASMDPSKVATDATVHIRASAEQLLFLMVVVGTELRTPETKQQKHTKGAQDHDSFCHQVYDVPAEPEL